MTQEPTPTIETRRSRKRRKTADHIVDVAYKLFSLHGYDAVTMEQIAAEADVAKGTLYNYFPVKEALVRHRMHADLAEQLPSLMAAINLQSARTDERLRSFLHAAAEYSTRSRDYLPQYIHYRLSQPISELRGDNRSSLNSVFEQLLCEGQAAGEITNRYSATLLADYLQFMHLSTLLRWLDQPDLQLTDAFDEMLDLFLHGCQSENKS